MTKKWVKVSPKGFADGGEVGKEDDDSGLLKHAPQFKREGSVENRGIAARARVRALKLSSHYKRGDDEGEIYVQHRLADAAESAADQAENYPQKLKAHEDAPGHAKGGLVTKSAKLYGKKAAH